MNGISQQLEQQHGLRISPGGKGVCPFCRHETFSVRKDDSIGKCFHPSCGKAVTQGSLFTGYGTSLHRVLDRVRDDCHKQLLDQTEKGKDHGYGYEFLTKERKIHPEVIHDLVELGAVPVEYDLSAAFKPAFDTIEMQRQELEAKIEESLSRRLEAKATREGDHKEGKQKSRPAAKSLSKQEKFWQEALYQLQAQRAFLEEHGEHLRERLKQAGGWLAFFHTDAHHRVCSIRFRKPFEKKFTSFCPLKQHGVFGHGLFSPYSASNKQKNRLILVEGEINLLQLHSLAVRTAAHEADTRAPVSSNGKHSPTYANWVAAVGSANGPDVETIRKLLKDDNVIAVPTVIQDHDDAGDALVEKLAQDLTLEVVKPPSSGSDIDDYIRSFGADHDAALAALADLFQGRQRRNRPFEALVAQIFYARQSHGKEDHRRTFEIHAEVKEILLKDLHERGTFYHEYRQGYFFFEEAKKLIALDDHDKELSCLLNCYGLNPSEKVFEHIAEELHIEALKNGLATRIHRFAWFDPQAFTLYVFNHASGIYQITADRIELVDNGTNGVLFLHDGRNEPFELVSQENLGDLFHETISRKINFQTEGRLKPDEQAFLFRIWFLSTFFGSLLPTRPILAFIGPKGSGKSHALRKVGVLLFGSRFEVKSVPDKQDSFDAIVTNSHFAALDNADSKVAWLPDRLAIAATGGTVSKRQLFTTNVLIDFPIDCFLGITSRTPHFNRDDVADRLLVNHVRRFEEGEFIAEHALLEEVLRSRSRILTAVIRNLQEVIKALKATAQRTYRTSFRLADFATFALRYAEAGKRRDVMEDIFLRMGEEQAEFTLVDDTLVDLLHLWLDLPTNHRRPLSAALLHKELKDLAKRECVEFTYKNGRSLGQRISNAEHNLRTVVGVSVEQDLHRRQKLYSFWPLPPGRESQESSHFDSAEDSAEATV